MRTNQNISTKLEAIPSIRDDQQNQSSLLGRTTPHGKIDLSRRRFIAVLSSTVAFLALSKWIPWKSEDSTAWVPKAFSFEEAMATMTFHNQHKIEPDMPTLLGCFVAFVNKRATTRQRDANYFLSANRVFLILKGVHSGKTNAMVNEALESVLRQTTNTTCGMHWEAAIGWLKFRIFDHYRLPEEVVVWQTKFSIRDILLLPLHDAS